MENAKEKTKAGRPTKYDPKYCDEIIKFFKKNPQKNVIRKTYNKDGSLKSEEKRPVAIPLPTIQGFARKIGVSRDTLHEWTQKYPEFSDAYARARDYQENILLVNAMCGEYNSQFAIFFAKNCLGYKDRTEVVNRNAPDISEAEAEEALEALGYAKHS